MKGGRESGAASASVRARPPAAFRTCLVCEIKEEMEIRAGARSVPRRDAKLINGLRGVFAITARKERGGQLRRNFFLSFSSFLPCRINGLEELSKQLLLILGILSIGEPKPPAQAPNWGGEREEGEKQTLSPSCRPRRWRGAERAAEFRFSKARCYNKIYRRSSAALMENTVFFKKREGRGKPVMDSPVAAT